jgi:hypothetical protein
MGHGVNQALLFTVYVWEVDFKLPLDSGILLPQRYMLKALEAT